MATKSKTEVARVKKETYPRKSVHVRAKATDSEEEKARQYAAVVTSPELAAYRVINGAEHNSGIGAEIDVPSLIADLRAQGAAVNSGEMRQAEAMLINQATALQSLFARLAERGMGCTGLAQFEADMRLALRAQSQCRAVMAEIQRRGLNVIQHGKAWRVYGLNVDIITCDLAQLDPDSLQPYLPRKGYGLRAEPMSQ